MPVDISTEHSVRPSLWHNAKTGGCLVRLASQWQEPKNSSINQPGYVVLKTSGVTFARISIYHEADTEAGTVPPFCLCTQGGVERAGAYAHSYLIPLRVPYFMV